MRWTDEVRIETPEQIDVDLELAGLGSRFVAQMLDWCVKIPLTVVLILIAATVAGVLGKIDTLESASMMLIAVVTCVVYVLWMTYDIVFEMKWNGQTIGKWVAGIRVLREGGAAIDFRTSCIRNMLSIADFMPGFFTLGALLIVVTARRQRLGDLAAGTVVVRERTLVAPADSVALIDEFARREIAFTAEQLRGCTPEDRQVLRSFLQRVDAMDPKSWDDLAHRLAEQFLRKTGYRPETPFATADDHAAFLASLYRDLEARAHSGP